MVRSKPTSFSIDRTVEREDFLNELEALEKELEISRGRGNLIILVVNEPYLRDMVIDFIGCKFIIGKVMVREGDQISRTIKKSSGFNVLLWLLPESVGSDILNALNYKRELFYETDFPNVVICNEGVLDAIVRDAPDFWRYRASHHMLQGIEPMVQKTLESHLGPHWKGEEDLLRQIEINEYLQEKAKSDDQKAFLFYERARLYTASGKYEKAIEYFHKSLELCEELKDFGSIARIYHGLGVIYQQRGEYQRAVDCFRKSLEISETLHDTQWIAAVYHQLGAIHQLRGEYEKAEEYSNKSLEISETLHDVQGIAVTYHNLGLIHQQRGEYEKAEEYFNKSLEISETLHDPQGIARTDYDLGTIYQSRGEYEKAEEYLNKSLEIFETLHDMQGTAIAYGQLGRLHIERKEYEEALKILLTTHDIFSSLQSPYINLVEKDISEIRHKLGEEQFLSLWKEVTQTE